MSLGSWLRRVFSSATPDDEAAEREDYGARDRGEAELERDRFSGNFASTAGAQEAADELDELKAPREPD